MVYVLADDITGANDTGVQFIKKEYKTIVHLMWETDILLENISQSINYDAIVIDTETRYVNPEEARKKIRQIISSIELKPDDIVYKKIDSTLKGNIATEIDEIIKVSGMDVCLIAPSYPANNRIVVNGFLIFGYNNDNKKVPKDIREKKAIEKIFNELKMPNSKIYLQDLLEDKESIIKNIEKDLKNNINIFIFDATSEEHLFKIYQVGSALKKSVLYAGSAGLASQFQLCKKKYNKIEKYNNKGSKYIFVNGSRNKISLEQIRILNHELKTKDLVINVNQLIKDNDAIKRYTSIAKNYLKQENILVIRVHQNNTKTEKNKKERFLEENIRSFLAKIVSNILDDSIDSIICIGGDTTFGVCKALDISSILLKEEILPGIPVAYVNRDKKNKIRIITKAGGFGKQDTLLQIVKYLRNN